MKQVRTACAAAMLAIGLLAGCAQGAPEGAASQPAQEPDTIKVVCTTFPAYDWARQVIGDDADRFELSYLMENGVDLHSYQPRVEDMAKIIDCDLFVYVGGESDEWADDAVAKAEGSTIHAVSMLKAVGSAAVEEELVEGMQADDHDHDEADDHDHDHDGEVEYDEHVWLSLRCASTIVDAIADELVDIDPANAATYEANAEAYDAQLAALDERYAQAVDAAAHDTLVFADRFPFRYLVDDYGLGYYAAFVGCSAETEASFETVAFLAQKVDELGVGGVLAIEGSDQHIARTVVESTQAKDQQVFVIDSLQSVAAADVASGKTYLSTMEQNLSVLKSVLN